MSVGNSKRVMLVVPLSVLLGGVGGGIVFPILPVLGVRFGLAGFFIGLILAANRISRLLTNQFAGELVDRLGGKKPLILGLLVESLGSLLYIVSLYVPFHGVMLFLARFIWGVGSAFLFIAANTVALNASVRNTRGKSTALVRIALSLGVPLGLVTGGILSGLFGDVVAFLFSALASLLASVIIWLFMSDVVVKSAKKVKLTEAILFSLKHKTMLLISIFNFLAFFSLQGVVMATLVLFIRKEGFSFIYADPKFSAGVIMSFMMISSAISGLFVGRVIDKIAIRSSVTLPSAFIIVLGFIILSLSHSSYQVIVALLLLGSGIGVNNITLLSVMGDLTPPEIRGRSVSVYQFMGDMGGTLGPIFGVQMGMIYGFRVTYLISAVMFLMFVPLIIQIKRQEREAKASPQ